MGLHGAERQLELLGDRSERQVLVEAQHDARPLVGAELCEAIPELVDPVVQRERFEAQALLAARGDDEAMRIDEDFLTAMEHAMPPSGGMGMGVDRLLIAMTGRGIRDTIPFPLVKPHA